MVRDVLLIPTQLRAMVDMRGNFVDAAILLVIGVVILGWFHSQTGTPTPRRWVPVAAFCSGPASALAWFLADALWISPHNYLLANDYVESLLPILTIGLIGGTIGSAAFWLAEQLYYCMARTRRPSTVAHIDEQSHTPEPAAVPVSSGESSPPAR